MDRFLELNSAGEERAIALVTPLVERAPEIAVRVARHRPFKSPDALFAAIRQELMDLGETERIDLFRAHPELAPDNPLTMTSESQSEQGRLNLTANDNDFRARLSGLNRRYREKFGFPFITALVRHADIDSVLRELEMRLASDRNSEIREALGQISIVSFSRVHTMFGSGDSPDPNIAAKNPCCNHSELSLILQSRNVTLGANGSTAWQGGDLMYRSPDWPCGPLSRHGPVRARR